MRYKNIIEDKVQSAQQHADTLIKDLENNKIQDIAYVKQVLHEISSQLDTAKQYINIED